MFIVCTYTQCIILHVRQSNKWLNNNNNNNNMCVHDTNIEFSSVLVKGHISHRWIISEW